MAFRTDEIYEVMAGEIGRIKSPVPTQEYRGRIKWDGFHTILTSEQRNAYNRAWYQENKVVILARARQRHKAHPEKKRLAQRKYYEIHRAKVTAGINRRKNTERYREYARDYSRRYYHRNKLAILKRVKSNRRKLCVYQREWRARNREHMRQYHRDYRARLRAA